MTSKIGNNFASRLRETGDLYPITKINQLLVLQSFATLQLAVACQWGWAWGNALCTKSSSPVASGETRRRESVTEPPAWWAYQNIIAIMAHVDRGREKKYCQKRKEWQLSTTESKCRNDLSCWTRCSLQPVSHHTHQKSLPCSAFWQILVWVTTDQLSSVNWGKPYIAMWSPEMHYKWLWALRTVTKYTMPYIAR